MTNAMSLEYIESGSFAGNVPVSLQRSELRVVSWNINRGRCFEQVLRFLIDADADLVFLQECDLNAVRSGSRNIARDLARELKLNYVFGVEFQELSQGNGKGPALHGQATLSRLALADARILRFKAQSNFWTPRWFLPNVRPMQRRLGGRMALITHVTINGRELAAYNVHLESRNGDDLRQRQLCELFDDVDHNRADVPIVVAGDFNCDVTDPSFESAIKNRGFQNPFAGEKAGVAHQINQHSGRIDWVVIHGPVVPVSRFVHDFAPGSDHSPRSLVLRLG